MERGFVFIVYYILIGSSAKLLYLWNPQCPHLLNRDSNAPHLGVMALRDEVTHRIRLTDVGWNIISSYIWICLLIWKLLGTTLMWILLYENSLKIFWWFTYFLSVGIECLTANCIYPGHSVKLLTQNALIAYHIVPVCPNFKISVGFLHPFNNLSWLSIKGLKKYFVLVG